MVARRLILPAVLLSATMWAGAMTVAGLMLVGGDVPAWMSLGRLGTLVGATLVVAGQFVFLTLVARRLARTGGRRFAAAVEATLTALLALGVALIGMHLFGGAAEA